MNSPYNTFVPHAPQKKGAKVKRLSWWVLSCLTKIQEYFQPKTAEK